MFDGKIRRAAKKFGEGRVCVRKRRCLRAQPMPSPCQLEESYDSYGAGRG